MVSVIIPCFNCEALVAEAIDSALAQTYPNIEVIVVDDGSSDGSLDVIKSFGDRIRWETGPNRGACAARNRGIEMANGEFVQFLDADDLLHPDKIAKQLPLAQSAEDLLVFCDLEDRIGTSPLPHLRRPDAPDEAIAFVLRGPLPTPAPLHRRWWLIEAGGFDETLPCSQERDLHLRLALRGLHFRRVPELLGTVRRRKGSLSSDSARVLDQHEMIFLRAWRELVGRGSANRDVSRLFAAAFVKDARAYVRLGRIESARRYAQIARELDPECGLSAFGGVYRVLAQTVGPVAAEQVLQRVPRLRPRLRQLAHVLGITPQVLNDRQ